MFKKRRFYGFYFTSENYIVYNNKRYWQEDDDTQKNKRNPKVYLVAKKVLNYEEVAKLGENVLLSNMKNLGWKYVVKTVLGNYQPYDKRTIILDENFNPSEPDAVWCSDITYIWTYEGFVYLTSIMDLYSRKIISWVLSDTLEAKWVIEAVNKAKASRNVDKPLILHTDRGIQYVCNDYIKATEGLQRSYSKKAYPWDNACIESFHALIKREWLNRFKILDYDHAYKLVFQYIETFYNTVRIHSHCEYLSPNEYEENYRKKLNAIELVA